MKYHIITTLWILLMPFSLGESRPDPLSMFKNLDKISKYYEDNRSEEERKRDAKDVNEKVWMYESAKNWKGKDDISSKEKERLWSNYREGANQRKYIAFAWISYFEPPEKWLGELKKLMKSDSEDDNLSAFHVVNGYAKKNHIQHDQTKEIFEDPEILDVINSYPDNLRKYDKSFQDRVEKLQRNVADITRGTRKISSNRSENYSIEGYDNTAEQEQSSLGKYSLLVAIVTGVGLAGSILFFLLKKKK